MPARLVPPDTYRVEVTVRRVTVFVATDVNTYAKPVGLCVYVTSTVLYTPIYSRGVGDVMRPLIQYLWYGIRFPSYCTVSVSGCT